MHYYKNMNQREERKTSPGQFEAFKRCFEAKSHKAKESNERLHWNLKAAAFVKFKDAT